MVGLVGLEDRPAWALAAARAPDGLAEQLIRPFRGALIGEIQGHVGRDDAHERDRGHVEALGHEAGPDEHVRLAGRERVEDAFRRSPSFRHVPVQPCDAQVGMGRAHLAFHPLRAAAEIADPRGAAGRAAGGERRGPAAVVAAQRRAGLVVHERPLAVRARLDVTAIPTQHDGRGAAPVEHEDRLLTGRGVERGQGVVQRLRQEPAVPFGELRAQVHDRHAGRRSTGPLG